MPAGASDAVEQTNAIGMAIRMLASLDITGKTITSAALLTQRKIAQPVVARDAHYLFVVKDNQPTLAADIRLRRFAVGLIKTNRDDSVAATIAKLARGVRRVFDDLLMTDNAKPGISRPAAEVG